MGTDEVKKRLAQAVLAERNRCGITQVELAKQIGISVRTLQKIENAEANPGYRTVYHLVRELCLDPNQILYGSEPDLSPVGRRLLKKLRACDDREKEFLIELFGAALEVYRSKK